MTFSVVFHTLFWICMRALATYILIVCAMYAGIYDRLLLPWFGGVVIVSYATIVV